MFRDRIRLATVGIILLGLVLVAGAWLFVLSPRLAESSQLEAQAQDLQLSQVSILRKQRDLVDLANQLPKSAAAAQKLFAAMPESAQLPELLSQLTQAATSAGIPTTGIQSINFSPPQSLAEATGADVTALPTGVQLATMPVDITVEGTEPQVTKFLSNMQNLKRSFLIEQVTLTDVPGTGVPKQTLTLTGTIFVLESPLPNLVDEAKKIAAAASDDTGVAAP